MGFLSHSAVFLMDVFVFYDYFLLKTASDQHYGSSCSFCAVRTLDCSQSVANLIFAAVDPQALVRCIE